MKKFCFSLESALTLRRFRKNEAAGSLAQAQARSLELAEELAAAASAVAESEAGMMPARGDSIAAAEIVRRQSALARRRSEVGRLSQEREEAVQQEDAQRERVLEARRREETILRLKEKEKERYRKELERADELAVSEFVSARIHLDKFRT